MMYLCVASAYTWPKPLRIARIDAALVLAEALGDHVAEVVVHRVPQRAEDVRIVFVRLRQHQRDAGAGGHGVGPQHVERDLLGPAGHVGIAGDEGGQPVRGDLGEGAEVEVVGPAQTVQARQGP